MLLFITITILAHTANAGLATFLDTLNTQRNTCSTSYDAILSSVTNITRTKILSGKKQTSTISNTKASEWFDIGEDWSNSAWYNPLSYLYSLSRIFHTTTITLSCRDGGIHGDEDFDAFENSKCNLDYLRIDVERDDNAICQKWEATDFTEPAHLITRWSNKASYVWHHNRFPTATELTKFTSTSKSKKKKQNTNNKKTSNEDDTYILTPGKTLSNLVRTTTPPWILSMTDVDHTVEHLFGFCKPCQNNDQISCGSPQPKSCQTTETYGDWLFRKMSFTSNTNENDGTEQDDDDATDDSDASPSLCPSTSADSKSSSVERTVLLPYTCDAHTCTFTLSPYQHPSIRIVDVRNPMDAPTDYWIDVTTQVNPYGVQSLLLGVYFSISSTTLAASSFIHSILGYVLGSTIAVGLAVQRVVRTTERNMLPGWVKNVGMAAVYVSPTLGFVALGPMYRNLVEPATNWVVGKYFLKIF